MKKRFRLSHPHPARPFPEIGSSPFPARCASAGDRGSRGCDLLPEGPIARLPCSFPACTLTAMQKWRVLNLIAVIVLGTSGFAAAGPKTDVVVLKNGDRVTCEIKRLSRGKLEVKTDSMDKIFVEWTDITALRSAAYFRVTASDRKLYFGSLEIRETTNDLRVASDTMVVTLPMLSAVEMTPIERSFWSQNKGSVSLGFNYAKSTGVEEVYFDFSNRYRTERNLVETGFSSTYTKGEESPDTKRRASVDAAFTRILRRGVNASVSAKIERNDELDVKKRVLEKVMVGNQFVATNQILLAASVGLARNAEQSYSVAESNESLEGVIDVGFSVFQYDHPETAVDVTLDVYPSVTESGRYRIDFSSLIRREIIVDFFFDVDFYVNYDNKPPSGGDPTSDYGITTSLVYSWN